MFIWLNYSVLYKANKIPYYNTKVLLTNVVSEVKIQWYIKINYNTHRENLSALGTFMFEILKKTKFFFHVTFNAVLLLMMSF